MSRKEEELKLVVEHEAHKLVVWLDEFQQELVEHAKSSENLNTAKVKNLMEEANVRIGEWTDLLNKKRSESEFKETLKSIEEMNSKLSGLVETIKDGLLSAKFEEKHEAVCLFSKVNINNNLWSVLIRLFNFFRIPFFKN